MIVTSELALGQRVAQEEVAGALGVSVAPVREALRILEHEGQVTYFPRRGYFVSELRIAALQEIYDLRRTLETRAVGRALPQLNDVGLFRMRSAAEDCKKSARDGDVAAELEANRRFHFAILKIPDEPHSMRLIRLLWDSTAAYRALYYNSAKERWRSIDAHNRILLTVEDRDVERTIGELDEHRDQALDVLRRIILPDQDG
jgi:DNA-binding GntR family transcriptional regulator